MASSKKPSSQKRADRERAENQTLNRVFVVFLIGLAVECYHFILYRTASSSINSMVACYDALNWITWMGFALLAVGAVAGYLKRKDRKVRTAMIWVSAAGLFLGASSWIMFHFSNGHQGIIAMCVLVPVMSVLALIFLLYQRECFWCSLVICCALFTVWLLGDAERSLTWRLRIMAGAAVGVVLVIVALYLLRKAEAGDGKLWGFRVCSPECDYQIVYVILGVAFACVALAVALYSFAYYLMWVLGIALFAELVYYTSKLM